MADLAASGRKDGSIMKIKKCAKNAILITVTIIASIVCMASLVFYDTNPDYYFKMGMIFGCWLLVFEIANLME